MWISKKELNELSEGVRRAIEGEPVELRDNREGALSILKNDISALVRINGEQTRSARRERDLLAKYMADISHQLKTPVTSMMIMSDLLDSADGDKREEFLTNIKVSLTRMEWLIDTLLKMAKLDSGAVEFSPVELTAAELAREAMQPLAILLDVKGQHVELSGGATLRCDRRWTAEALTNLLKNASEHSPAGGAIYVGSGENPIYGWISVTDSGTGFSREEYAGAFRRFEYSRRENGYGIGLPLALSIVRGQNGDIDIDAGGKGRGATLTVKLFK